MSNVAGRSTTKNMAKVQNYKVKFNTFNAFRICTLAVNSSQKENNSL
jgi:hypothetical protein